MNQDNQSDVDSTPNTFPPYVSSRSSRKRDIHGRNGVHGMHERHGRHDINDSTHSTHNGHKKDLNDKNIDNIDKNITLLTKDELKAKLHDKINIKKTSRLSKDARYRMMDDLEEKIFKGKGTQKMRQKLDILEHIENNEIDNENNRTIPDIEY